VQDKQKEDYAKVHPDDLPPAQSEVKIEKVIVKESLEED